MMLNTNDTLSRQDNKAELLAIVGNAYMENQLFPKQNSCFLKAEFNTVKILLYDMFICSIYTKDNEKVIF